MSGPLLRFDTDGRRLTDDDAHWAALWAPRPGAWFAVPSLPAPASRAECEAACGRLRLLGREDWRLARVEDLQWLLDRSRQERLFGGGLFDARLADADIADWCWSATPAAWSNAIGWGIGLADGAITHRPVDRPGMALAVAGPVAADHRQEPALAGWTGMVSKLDAHGRALADGATDWAAVHLPGLDLIFSATAVCARGPQQDCAAACARLDLAGWRDWRLPAPEQMQWLVNRRRHAPAVSPGLPIRLAPDWYWTAQPHGWEDAMVGWIVDLEDGYIGYQERDYGGLALAVREGRPRR